MAKQPKKPVIPNSGSGKIQPTFDAIRSTRPLAGLPYNALVASGADPIICLQLLATELAIDNDRAQQRLDALIRLLETATTPAATVESSVPAATVESSVEDDQSANCTCPGHGAEGSAFEYSSDCPVHGGPAGKFMAAGRAYREHIKRNHRDRLRGVLWIHGDTDFVLYAESERYAAQIVQLVRTFEDPYNVDTCPHGNDPAECDACFQASDHAFDADRERRTFGQ